MKKLLFLAVAGLLARWLLDPEHGAARRAMVMDRVGGTVRSVDVPGPVGGTARDTRPLQPQLEVDDVTLARKVESELFRSDDVQKGNVDVNVEFGRVVLRGEVERAELIDDLVARARAVDGVSDVESLLHTPDEPAPMHH